MKDPTGKLADLFDAPTAVKDVIKTLNVQRRIVTSPTDPTSKPVREVGGRPRNEIYQTVIKRSGKATAQTAKNGIHFVTHAHRQTDALSKMFGNTSAAQGRATHGEFDNPNELGDDNDYFTSGSFSAFACFALMLV